MQEELPKKEIKTLLQKQNKFKLLFSLSLVLLLLSLSTVTFGYFENREEQSSTQSKNEITNSLEQENLFEDSDVSTDPESDEVGDDGEETKTEDPTSEEKESEKTDTPKEKDSKTESPTEPDPDPTPVEEEPTPPAPESPSAYVAFYADNQSDTDQEDLNHERVVNYILNTGANPVFHAGDLMENGTEDSLNRFNSVTSTLRSSRTFYAALGNNDRKVGDSSTPSQLFLDNFVFPNNEQWYSVNYGNLHLVVLDSAFSASSSTQQSWLLSDLQSSNSQNRITAVMFHHPTFSSTISQKLIDYGVDFVVAGHYHAYSHSTSNGINYFVLSGQPSLGYMTAKIYSDRVTIKVYNSSNTVVDTVEFPER